MKKLVSTLSLFILVSTFLHANTTRIMLLGDSITYDDAYRDHRNLRPNVTPRPSSQRHGYRNHLWYKLQDAKYDVKFVGSRIAGEDIVPAFDPHNEGYPGWTSAQLASITYSRLVDYSPDIILLHIGSNDWSESVSYVDKILNEIQRYEDRYHHPIKVILARIINRRAQYGWISNFNRNLQNLANNRFAHGDDIVVVDMEHNAGINYSADFQDPTHPNDTGYQKMANLWFSTLQNILPSFVPNPLIEPFVKRFYTSILLREGEEAGVKYWSEKLQNKQLTAADLARGFIFSDEFTAQENDNETYISTLYRAFFDREGDVDGVQYWLDKLETGSTPYQVLNGFLYSQEFYTLAETYNILPVDKAELFIGRLYNKVLGRDAEQKGMENWLQLLHRYKTNATSLAQSFFFSQEFINKETSNDEYTTFLYQSILGREPDIEGLNHWTEKLDSGTSRLKILQSFTHSKEFKALAREYDIDL